MPEDKRSIAQLLVDQVEFCNLLIVNKQDLVPSKQDQKRIVGMLKALNPTAEIVFSTKCQVSTKYYPSVPLLWNHPNNTNRLTQT